MKELILVKHASGAPGLRLFGIGPSLLPQMGIHKLQRLLNRNTSWAAKRKKNDIRKMLSKSDVIVSAWKGNNLIGFGRATSDNVFRSVLWDVVVEKKYQRYGIGRLLINTLLTNKVISKAEKIYVMTTHFEDFYSKMGFEVEKTQKLMILKKNKSL